MDRFQDMTTDTTPNKVVSILVSDIKRGKELSDIFRQIGVHPYVCTSLPQFWGEAIKETPHLAIIDVKHMSQGEYLLKDHPKVKSEEMPIVFTYENSSAPLLYSTFDLLSLGSINMDLPLTGQVKSILKRFNTFQSWQVKAKAAMEEEEKLGDKLSHIVERTEELKEKQFYQALQKSLQGRFELERDTEDFQVAAARVFSQVKEVKSFTFLELSPSGQKLVSPKFQYDKYMEIPSLWLGKACQKGIEFFAQNMASQICLELMGGELMSLLLRGKKDEPEMMVFLRVESEDFLAKFDWESLERYLSGFYCYFQLKNQEIGKQTYGLGSSWDLYDMLDEMKLGGLPESRVEGGFDRFALVSINFSSLYERALKQNGMRFYWKRFFQGFINGLEVQRDINAKVFHIDPKQTMLLIDKENLDKDLSSIKNYALRFQYWRYFEDSDVVLGASLKPDVRVVPMSPQAVERLRESDFVASIEAQAEEANALKQLEASKTFYHPGLDQNM